MHEAKIPTDPKNTVHSLYFFCIRSRVYDGMRDLCKLFWYL